MLTDEINKYYEVPETMKTHEYSPNSRENSLLVRQNNCVAFCQQSGLAKCNERCTGFQLGTKVVPLSNKYEVCFPRTEH